MQIENTPFGKAVTVLILTIALVLLYEALIDGSNTEKFQPKKNQPCEGEALNVDYPYYGGMLQDHACKPQCTDKVQRFVLYSNGKATQCQKVPGCLDWGEDRGVTCVPPLEE